MDMRRLLLFVALCALAGCGSGSTGNAHPSVTASPDPPGTRVLRVDPALSSVSYTVTEHVPTISQFHPVIGTFRVTGRAPVRGGTVHLAPTPAASTVRAVTVDPLALKTDIAFRDTNVDPLLTAASGFAEFDSTSLSGFPDVIPAGGPVKFKMSGQMQIHGVVKPVDFDVTATMAGDRLDATATTVLDMRDFSVDPPSGVASTVDPQVTLAVHIVARP
jgi:polyisoprenoid-binding protein YceI